MNMKGLFKSIIAGATIVGGAILGNEARKCFTKPVNDTDEFDDAELGDLENLEATEENSAEEADEDEPEEIPED